MRVGDYVRNSHYGIGKINGEYDYKDEHWYNVKFAVHDENDEEYHCGICERSIGFKTSPNIIDLIEVGDYVNGFKVVWKDINKKEFSIHSYYASENIINNSKKIKTILTREQFESMEYKIC